MVLRKTWGKEIQKGKVLVIAGKRMSDERDIEDFLKAIEQSFSGLNPKTFWPLNGGQIDSYFDIVESLDMYYRLKKLKEEFGIDKILELMPEPDIIRIFLQHNAIIGLKEANRFKIDDISKDEIVDYLLLLFDVLRRKVKSDIFCLDGKNFLLDETEIRKTLFDTNWDNAFSDKDKKTVAFLTVLANNVCYTLFYDVFMTGGFYIHGPYDSSEKFGENSILLVREYHNLNPIELWPNLDSPCDKLKICAVYRNLDLKLNFSNHPLTRDSIADKLIAYKVYLDDKEINFDKINELIEFFPKVATQQTKIISEMSDLDKVRKGAEIAYYLFRKLRKGMGDDWRPSKIVEENIKEFGDEFIHKFRYQEEIPSLEHWRRLFDPRDDYC